MNTAQKSPLSPSSYLNSILRTRSYFRRFNEEIKEKEDSCKQQFLIEELPLKLDRKSNANQKLKLGHASASISGETSDDNKCAGKFEDSLSKRDSISIIPKPVSKRSTISVTSDSVGKRRTAYKLIKRGKFKGFFDDRKSRCRLNHVQHYDHFNCYCTHLPLVESRLKFETHITGFDCDKSQRNLSDMKLIEEQSIISNLCQENISNIDAYQRVNTTQLCDRKHDNKTFSLGGIKRSRVYCKVNEDNSNENLDLIEVSKSLDLHGSSDTDLRAKILDLVITVK